MSVVNRCNYKGCHKFMSIKATVCPHCNKPVKSKLYYAVYREGSKQRWVAIGNDMTIARKYDFDIKALKKQGVLPDEYQTKKPVLFADFMNSNYLPNWYLKNKSKPPMYIFDVFVKAFGNKTLREITPADIDQTIKTHWRDKKTTYNHAVKNIKTIFTYAIEQGITIRNPVKIKTLPNNNVRNRFLTTLEKIRLLEVCRKSSTKYLYEMVFIALNTGLRIGEIRTLTPGCITDEGVTVKSEFSKNGLERTVPLSSSAKEFFKTATFNYNHDIKKSFALALKRAEIDNFRFHDLRHTYASQLVQAGVSLQEVKELLGHQTLEMTMRYAHLSKENLKRAVEKLEADNQLLRIV